MRSIDQRKSNRRPVDETRQACELKVGAERIPAILLNESSGGFSILVDRPPGVSIHQRAELGTQSGWFPVRVVHMNRVEPHGEIAQATAAEKGTWHRLGLRRLGDASITPESSATPASNLCGSLTAYLPSGTMMIILGVLFSIVVAVWLLGMTDVF